MIAKGELRARYKAARDAMDTNLRGDLSAAICGHILSWDRTTAAKTIFVYASMGSEVDTMGLIAGLRAMDKRVLLPRVRDGKHMDAVEYSGGILTKSNYGALEPSGKPFDAAKIDLSLAPALAVTIAGVRLGYGGGYYDRFLKRTQAHRAALCFSCQVVDSLPSNRYDIGMDSLITEHGIRRAGEDIV